MIIPRVHLKRSGLTRRGSDHGKAYPLNEKDMPKSNGTPESCGKIIDYLDVEKSARYKRTHRSTFCNIYAHDYAALMGAYVPRVWWVDSVLKSKSFGLVKYGHTVRELNANSLAEWFKEYGSQFGWRKLDRISEIVGEANKGKCVILVAANKTKSRSGHIVAAVPETDEHKAMGARGTYIYPLQSQAGGTNRKYFASSWWKSGHDPMGAYVFEGKPEFID